jgi:hypothetical protein
MKARSDDGDRTADKNPYHVIYDAPEKNDHHDQTRHQNNMEEKDKIGHEDTFKMSALFFFLLKYHNWSLAHPFIDFLNALIVLSAFPNNAGAFQGQRMFLALNSIS